MRVLIAPAAFAGTLSAVEAAAAMGHGWGRRAPDDQLDLAPMSDGGSGFVDVLHAGLGGRLSLHTVSGPYGDPVPATLLLVDPDNGPRTAYVEAAQACGLALTSGPGRDVERAGSAGVGQLVLAALDAGAERVVVGLGGVGANDGAAGLLAALGATGEPDGVMRGGAAELGRLSHADLSAARQRIGDTELVAATDVDAPLLGLTGTTNVQGPQRGVDPARLQAVDLLLEQFVASIADGSGPDPRKTARGRAAGAGGGLGFGLLLLGGRVQPGVELVAAALGLPERARRAEVVVTGEGAFDFSSRSGKVPYGVAAVAATALQPCIALAGQVLVGSREMRALGIEAAYSMVDLVGEERSLADPAGSLAALAERTARTWSR